MALQKVQMNLDEQLIKQVDEYAATLHAVSYTHLTLPTKA